MGDDIVFGSAVVGSVSRSQPSVLVGSDRRVASRKPKLPSKEMADIVVFSRPEDLRLIRIPDRNAPDWCEVCGIEHGLFWTGSMVMCIQCSKDAKLFKKEGLPFIDKAKTPQEFFEWLCHQKYLMRRLFDAGH